MKTLLGFKNVAGVMDMYSHSLGMNGNSIYRLIVSNNPFYSDVGADKYIFHPLKSGHRVVDMLRKFVFKTRLSLFFLLSLYKFNRYIYLGADYFFLPFGLDLFILKAFRKDVVIVFQGSDVRYYPLHNAINRSCKIPEINFGGVNSFWSCLFRQKLPEWLRLKTVSMRNQSTFASRPYYFFRFLQLEGIKFPKIPNQQPVIVHAPSNRNIKGTDYVLAAIERLRKNGYKFDFILIENKSNAEVVSMLKNADIALDQPGTWVAKFAVEACAQGCCVIGGNEAEYEGAPFLSPVIKFKPSTDSLYEQLTTLLNDRNYLEDRMQRCFEFWLQYYSSNAFTEWLGNICNDKKVKQVEVCYDWKRVLQEQNIDRLQKLAVKWFC